MIQDIAWSQLKDCIIARAGKTDLMGKDERNQEYNIGAVRNRRDAQSICNWHKLLGVFDLINSRFFTMKLKQGLSQIIITPRERKLPFINCFGKIEQNLYQGKKCHASHLQECPLQVPTRQD